MSHRSLRHNLVVTKRTRRLSRQLPLTSVGEWCAAVVNLHTTHNDGQQRVVIVVDALFIMKLLSKDRLHLQKSGD